uniref:Uncharacterized protein n=1 Tax=Arundo donax TaxID=35708 RepID=A0A0A9HFH3_ARUDO
MDRGFFQGTNARAVALLLLERARTSPWRKHGQHCFCWRPTASRGESGDYLCPSSELCADIDR